METKHLYVVIQWNNCFQASSCVFRSCCVSQITLRSDHKAFHLCTHHCKNKKKITQLFSRQKVCVISQERFLFSVRTLSVTRAREKTTKPVRFHNHPCLFQRIAKLTSNSFLTPKLDRRSRFSLYVVWFTSACRYFALR